MIWVWRGLLILGLIGISYLIAVYRVGGVGPNDFTYPKYSSSDLAGVEGLFPPLEPWQVQRSEALLDQSQAIYNLDINQALSSESLAEAKALALQSLKQDITFGYGAAQLLSIYEKQQDLENANQLATLATDLAPAHIATHSYVANYWLRQGNLEKVLYEWNILLTRDPNKYKTLFPILLQVISENINDFIPFIETPPTWWNRFFTFVAQSSEHGELLEVIYNKRIQLSNGPLSSQELNTYIARLIKDGFWAAAKQAWIEGLLNHQIKFGGTIYDGGFEDTRNINKGGFYWSFGRHKLFTIEPSITSGMKGSSALKINLRNTVVPINFQHVSQNLALESNAYIFNALYKVDKLTTTGGLSWRIRCQDTQKTLLGESTAIKERTSWSSLSIRFTVPSNDTCEGQMLRLEAASPYAHNKTFNGTVWFDQLSIVPIINEERSE
ncbi:tetratricopeptide repeat protein [Thiofilum flexile]|uniref:tetratricopeptide repeat protein n=1 Tax=Thiofilum flexile TaxID=125627 RepID=UPI000377A353|nr:hypothetical protein [Thiofilum flexile]